MGASVIEARPLSGQGTRTLQDAYDAAIAAPQITPDLTQGFEINGRVDIDGAIDAGNANSLVASDTTTQTGAFVGGVILSNGTYTTGVSTTWIWALLQESKIYRININPAFAAFTLFNALGVIENEGNFNLPQGLILNNGLAHRRRTSGTSTTVQSIGLSNSPNTRTLVAGAVMTKTTGDTAVRHSPTFGTVAGSTVNMGTQRGLHCVNPAVGLFQPQAGVENLTAYIGVEIDAIPFGGNVTKRGFRSALINQTNTLMIENTGGAHSDFGAGRIRFDDLSGIELGNSRDMLVSYAGGVDRMFWQHVASGGGFDDQLQWGNDAAGSWLCVGGAGAAAVDELKFDFTRMAFGQAGAVGNQKMIFVANAETVTVAGEYSQFLLTQSGNDTIDAALSLYAGWTINAPNPTIGTGSLTTGVGLNVGGNPSGTVNRVGVRIISNPSGGSGINAALWVTAGLSRFDGRVDINNGVALGGGAAATLGTIGGSGPTAAAQAQWVEIDIGGTPHWIPAWT